MNPENFEQKMESLQKPDVSGVQPPGELKLMIVNAQRSAAIGVWFVAVPCFFLACVVMKYIFRLNLGLLDTFEEMMAAIDKNPNTWWIQPVLLMGLPLISIMLNALAILHFKWGADRQSLIITLKFKWLNILVLAVSLAVVKIFILYLLTENFQARPGH